MTTWTREETLTTSTEGALQLHNTLTVGVNNTGHDVKFFGDLSDNFMIWDESQNRLEIRNTGANNAITLTNTDSGGINSPGLSYYRNSASAAASDVLGITTYWGRSAGGASSDERSPHTNYDDVIYARLQSSIIDATDGGEEGQFKIGVIGNGAFAQDALTLTGTSSGNVDLILGNSTSSKIAIRGYFAANNATPAAAPDYAPSSYSTNRTITGATSAADTTDVLATLIADLIAIGLLQ
jgi:hypothetical protein